MKIRLKQILTSTLLACMMAVMIPFHLMTALAAEARISFSDPSVMVGKEVSVTMKITSIGGEPLGGADVTLSYDPNVLEFVSGTNASGGAGSVRVVGSMESADTTTFKFTLKFKALQAGKSKITVARQEVNDLNTQPVTVSRQGDSTVNVTPLATYSNDAALKSLKIDPGTLTPNFSSGVTEYTATVGGDVSKLVVSAGTSNANAKVVISGTELKEGENTVVCKVTAEDGETVKKYTIKVTKTAETTAEEPAEGQKTELGDIKTTVDGTEYFVAAAFDSSLLPAGFQAGRTAYQGGEVASATGNGMTLFYLEAANGNGGFYVYDEASGSLTRFVSVSTTQIMVIPSALDEGVTVPQGFTESTIEIDGNTINGWVWSSEGQESPYFVFYGTGSTGQKDFYRYDATEKTLQRYFQDPNADSGVSTEQYVDVAEKYNSLIKDYKLRFIIICVLIGLAVLLLIMVVLLLTGRKGSPYDPDDRDRRKGKKEKKKSAKKSSALDFLEDDEDGEFDDYYDESSGDYRDKPDTRQKDLKEKSKSRAASPGNRYEDENYRSDGYEDDDFEELENLEDMERSLAARLAKEARTAKAEAVKVQPVVRRKTSDQSDMYSRPRETAARPAREAAERRTREYGFADGSADGYSGEAEEYGFSGRPDQAYDVRPRNVRPLYSQNQNGRQTSAAEARAQEAAGRAVYHQGYDDRPDRSQGSGGRQQDQWYDGSQDMNGRPVSGQGAAVRPVQGSDGRSMHDQRAAGRAEQGQQPVRRPGQGQGAGGYQPQEHRPAESQGYGVPARRIVHSQEPGRPVQGQDPSRRSIQDQEAVRRTAQGQDVSGRPASGREPYGRSRSGHEAAGRPVVGYEAAGRPVSGQEAVRRPAQGQEPERRPAQGQEPERRPVQGQEPERRPVQGQEPERRLMQSQEPERRPAWGDSQAGQVRAQNEAAGYRQPQRRPVSQDDDDFEFLDLD